MDSQILLPKIVDLNGTKVVLLPERRQSVTVRVLVGSGSREEPEGKAGVAHFLEHFVFKGTKQFPGIFDIDEAIEKVGGFYNAYTGLEDMGFWVKTDARELELAVRSVGQLVSEPLLQEKHFTKEKGTIIEEVKMYEDRPDTKADMEMVSLLYGKNSGLGRPIIGSVKSINGLKIGDLKDYLEDWVIPSNVMIGVEGNYGDEKKLLKLIEKEFSGLLKRSNVSPDRQKHKWEKQSQPKIKLIKRQYKQTNISLGFRGLELSHRLRYALYLTNLILGDSLISRLGKEIREKRGWAYSIGSAVENYKDVGSLEVGAGIPRNRLRDVFGLMMEIMTGVGCEGKWSITEKELEMAKRTFVGRVMLNFDMPERVLGFALYDLMFEGKIFTPEEVREKIDGVRIDEIREVCSLVFKPEFLNVAVVGDYEQLPLKI